MEKTQKELCRMRIKVLQEAKEDLFGKMFPLIGDATVASYVTLYDDFNKLIDEEAGYLLTL